MTFDVQVLRIKCTTCECYRLGSLYKLSLILIYVVSLLEILIRNAERTAFKLVTTDNILPYTLYC